AEVAADHGGVAAAVVGDGEHDLVLGVRQAEPRLGGVSVTYRVPQPFLGDLEQRVLDRRGKLALTGGHPDGDPQLPGGPEVRGQVTQRLAEAGARLLEAGQ